MLELPPIVWSDIIKTIIFYRERATERKFPDPSALISELNGEVETTPGDLELPYITEDGVRVFAALSKQEAQDRAKIRLTEDWFASAEASLQFDEIFEATLLPEGM